MRSKRGGSNENGRSMSSYGKDKGTDPGNVWKRRGDRIKIKWVNQ